MKTRFLPALLAGIFALPTFALAADWPQWRGPERANLSSEKGLLKAWPKDGPRLLWTFEQAGAGYSGPAVVGERLYSIGARGDSEFLYALDLKSGTEAWSVKIGPRFTFKGNSWGDGPRSTPTVDKDSIFALGGQGDLVCVESASGKEMWRKNLPADLKAEVNNVGGSPEKIGWGFTWSPVVDGEHLICVPGGSEGLLAALNKKTGEVVWRSAELTDQAPYSSPLLSRVGERHQIVQMTYLGVAGVAAKDGKLLWYYKRKPAYQDVVIPTPIVHDSQVYTSAGYGGGKSVGCDLVKLTEAGAKIKAEKVYSNQNLINRYGGVVLVNDHVYGYSEKNRAGNGWTCQDFKTGKVVWSENRALGRGSLTYADGHLYCFTEEDGIVSLVEASPAGWKENSRFSLPRQTGQRAPNGKSWTPPVVADGKLFLRDQELIFCYDVKDSAASRR